MKRSTALYLVIVGIAVAQFVALSVWFGPWAAAVVLATAVISHIVERGAKSLEAGGE